MKKLISLLIILALSLSLVACSDSSSGNVSVPSSLPSVTQASYPNVYEIVQKGYITVGITPDYMPYASVDMNNLNGADDKYYGYDLSLVRYIADVLGVDLYINTYDFEVIFDALDSGECDIVMSGIAVTEEREELYAFTDAYLEGIDQVMLIATTDVETLVNAVDFNGTTIAAEGVTMTEIAENAFGANGAQVQTLFEIETGVEQLLYGNIDGVMMSEPVAMAYALKYEELSVSSVAIVTSQLEPSAIALSQGKDDLIEYLNLIIEHAKEDGMFDDWTEEIAEIISGMLE